MISVASVWSQSTHVVPTYDPAQGLWSKYAVGSGVDHLHPVANHAAVMLLLLLMLRTLSLRLMLMLMSAADGSTLPMRCCRSCSHGTLRCRDDSRAAGGAHRGGRAGLPNRRQPDRAVSEPRVPTEAPASVIGVCTGIMVAALHCRPGCGQQTESRRTRRREVGRQRGGHLERDCVQR